MSKQQKMTMAKVGASNGRTYYSVMPVGMANSVTKSPSEQYLGDSSAEMTDLDDCEMTFLPAWINQQKYIIAPYGVDNMLPYWLRRKIRKNQVTSSGQSFNITSCYGQGLKIVDRSDKKRKTTDDPDIRDFCLRNCLPEVFIGQCTDMKFFYFSILVIILDRAGDKIVQVRHKDACNCRLEKAVNGKIQHVIYGDWKRGTLLSGEVIPLLDPHDPYTDLMVRMGKQEDPMTGKKGKMTKDRKFAILSRMPTPGLTYYPMPYYASIFRDDWYDIYKLIGLGKKYMIKNNSAPRTQIEVKDEYWGKICEDEGITDEAKCKSRIKQAKQDIIDFVCGPENAGKALITGYMIDPISGKEVRDIRIYNLNESGTKEGGDYLDDSSEASNFLCFALGVHPNLIGATPGKSQMNNSGSDKRELFTLKQSTEIAFHDIMSLPWHLILHYNNWSDKYSVDVPMIELTTLDQNKSSQMVTPSANQGEDNNGNKNQ